MGFCAKNKIYTQIYSFVAHTCICHEPRPSSDDYSSQLVEICCVLCNMLALNDKLYSYGIIPRLITNSIQCVYSWGSHQASKKFRDLDSNMNPNNFFNLLRDVCMHCT